MGRKLRGPLSPVETDLENDRQFLAMLHDLDTKRAANTRESLILASAWLRTLLVEGDWLHRIRRRHQVEMCFHIAAIPTIDDQRVALGVQPVSGKHFGKIVPEKPVGQKEEPKERGHRKLAPPATLLAAHTTLRPISGLPVRCVTLDEFLGLECLAKGESNCNVRDIIKAVANAKGGVHTPGKGFRGNRKTQQEAVLELDQCHFFSELEASLAKLTEIIDITLAGLWPLIRRIERQLAERKRDTRQ